MDSRERLARELCKMGGINPDAGADRSTGYTTPRWHFDLERADRILASDWLRDTLAAERERCAKVADGSANLASMFGDHNGWRAAGSIAQSIRNLEPEASDGRG